MCSQLSNIRSIQIYVIIDWKELITILINILMCLCIILLPESSQYLKELLFQILTTIPFPYPCLVRQFYYNCKKKNCQYYFIWIIILQKGLKQYITRTHTIWNKYLSFLKIKNQLSDFFNSSIQPHFHVAALSPLFIRHINKVSKGRQNPPCIE